MRHWCLFPWVFVSCCQRPQYILLQYFLYLRFVSLIFKATYQARHLYLEVSPKHIQNFLGWRLPLTGSTITFIVLVLFSVSTATFLTKGRIWIPRWLDSVGGLGVTWTPSDINNYLTPGLNLLNKVVEIPNGNKSSCGSASALMRDCNILVNGAR